MAPQTPETPEGDDQEIEELMQQINEGRAYIQELARISEEQGIDDEGKNPTEPKE